MPENPTTTTRTTAVLLQIMGDRRQPIHQRIQAAESLITFEVPEEIAERTKAFLVAVVESPQVALNLRLEAGRLMRKVESRRVATPGTRTVEPGKWRETFRAVAIARRRMRLIKQNLWPCPKDWHADLSASDYVPPWPNEVPR